jgi:hypothetical protein
LHIPAGGGAGAGAMRKEIYNKNNGVGSIECEQNE